MKRKIAFLIALVMLLSLTACGGMDDSKRGTITDSDSVTEENDIQTETSDEGLSAIDRIGEAEGDTYENEWLGLGFRLPEGWSFYTQEQMNELNNIALDMLDEELSEQLEQANVIYDMYALDQYGNSVNIVMEKMGAIGLEEDAYAEASVSQLEEGLKQIGYSQVSASTSSTEFNGEEHASIDVVATTETVSFYEKIICVKKDGYMICITIGTMSADSINDVLGYFYTTEE